MVFFLWLTKSCNPSENKILRNLAELNRLRHKWQNIRVYKMTQPEPRAEEQLGVQVTNDHVAHLSRLISNCVLSERSPQEKKRCFGSYLAREYSCLTSGASWVSLEKCRRFDPKNSILMTSICPEFRHRLYIHSTSCIISINNFNLFELRWRTVLTVNWLLMFLSIV